MAPSNSSKDKSQSSKQSGDIKTIKKNRTSLMSNIKKNLKKILKRQPVLKNVQSQDNLVTPEISNLSMGSTDFDMEELFDGTDEVVSRGLIDDIITESSKFVIRKNKIVLRSKIIDNGTSSDEEVEVIFEEIIEIDVHIQKVTKVTKPRRQL